MNGAGGPLGVPQRSRVRGGDRGGLLVGLVLLGLALAIRDLT
jgi:hypothetical protein